MSTTVVELLLAVPEFFSYVVARSVYFLIVILDTLLSDVFPVLFQMFLYGLNFVLVMSGLLIKSIIYVTYFLYDAVVQLNWQYIAQAASGCTSLLAEGTMLCGNSTIAGIEFLFGLLWSLLLYPASFLYAIALYVSDVVGTSVAGREDWEMLLGSSMVSSRTIRYVVTLGVYVVVLIFAIALLFLLVMLWRDCLMPQLRLMKTKFSNTGHDRPRVESSRPLLERSKRSNTPRRVIETHGNIWNQQDNDDPMEEDQLAYDNMATPARRRRKTSTSPSAPNDSDQAKMKLELDELKRQLEKQEEEKQCAVCYENPRTMVVHPCHHYCLCELCRGRLKKCPICNKRIEFAQKIFNV